MSLLLATHLIPSLVAAQSYTGEATFFNNPPGADGACGIGFSDTEYIAAVSEDLFKGFADPAFCGKKARVEYKDKSVTVTLIDSCPTCSKTSLDLSPAAFDVLELPDIGVLAITWSLVVSDDTEGQGTSSSIDTPATLTDSTATPIPFRFYLLYGYRIY
ncbi:hypothetical protein BASA60_006528 [Batrachochytrium salamandrivorans]|nr:hypothetical protein BASA60_006528 [Batrachochytrium salamandrivorans]